MSAAKRSRTSETGASEDDAFRRAVPMVDLAETADVSPQERIRAEAAIGAEAEAGLVADSQGSSQFDTPVAELPNYARESSTAIAAASQRAFTGVTTGSAAAQESTFAASIREAIATAVRESVAASTTASTASLGKFAASMRESVAASTAAQESFAASMRESVAASTAAQESFAASVRESVAASTKDTASAVAAIGIAVAELLRRQPTEPVEPPQNALLDDYGRYVDLRYRLWYAYNEFKCRVRWIELDGDVDNLNKLLEYAFSEALPPKTKRKDGKLEGEEQFIVGNFLGIFERQQGQLSETTIYVRHCYPDFRKRLMEEARTRTGRPGMRCRLTGNPGIGKSTFLVYHVIELLKEECCRNANESAGTSSKRTRLSIEGAETSSGRTRLSNESAETSSNRTRLSNKSAETSSKCAGASNESGTPLKILLSTGTKFYLYSLRTGWLQVEPDGWNQMYSNAKNSDAWLLVDSLDIILTPQCQKVLSVSSPNLPKLREIRPSL